MTIDRFPWSGQVFNTGAFDPGRYQPAGSEGGDFSTGIVTATGGTAALSLADWTSLILVQGHPAMRANSIVLFGDSITSQNDYFGTSNWGWFTRANCLMGQPFDVVNNAGVSGDTTTQMLARIQTDVLAYKPRWVHFLGGVNDNANGITTATSIANITAILSTLVAAGIQVIIGPILPQASINQTTAQIHWDINNFIQQYAKNHDGVLYVDYARALIGTSTMANTLVNAPLSGVMADNLHPSALGGGLMAAQLVKALSGIVPMPNARNLSNRITTSGDQTVLIDNAMMIYGTGGSLTGSNNTAKSTGLGAGEVGGAPQAWTVANGTNTTVLKTSTVPRANCFNDGLQGSALRVDFSGVGAGEIFFIQPQGVTFPTVNQTYVVELELFVLMTSGTLDGFNPVVFTTGGTFTGASHSNGTAPSPSIWNGGQGNMLMSAFTGTLRSYPFTIGSAFSAFVPYTQVTPSTGASGFVCVTNYVIRPWTNWVPF